mmetsp:Transcript_2952/g.5613  ORF Transcript_2952/g.5613 Transcript_2952/m.5613 type:complete len:276 (+) Transcript_2952:1192-2019(+)
MAQPGTWSERLADLWYRLYVFIYRLSLSWSQRGLRVGRTHRRVALIGDGLAEGIGDGLAHLGLARRVQQLILREGHQSPTNLNLRWQVVTEGRHGTSPNDWLPSKDRYLRAVEHGMVADADVVVLLFSGESEPSWQPTEPGKESCNIQSDFVRSIELIAKDLVHRGKHVVIGEIPGIPKRSSSDLRGVIHCNRKLSQEMEEWSSESRGYLQRTLAPETIKVVQQRALCLDSDGWLNSHGYRMLARMTLDAITSPMKKVEWKILSPGLIHHNITSS